ncbi:MAG: hypothetical protein GY854_08155 [Deltaproteobacteria bacterium]|nr:hypothetical protein [Deltaproteobacteria bacterium]
MLKAIEKLLSCGFDELSTATSARLPVIFRARATTYVDCHDRLQATEKACRAHCSRHGLGFQMPEPVDKTSLKSFQLTLFHDGKYALAEKTIILTMKLASDPNLQDTIKSIAIALDHFIAFTKEYGAAKDTDISISQMLFARENAHEQTAPVVKKS